MPREADFLPDKETPSAKMSMGGGRWLVVVLTLKEWEKKGYLSSFEGAAGISVTLLC